MKKAISFSLVFLLLLSFCFSPNFIYAENLGSKEFNSFEFRDNYNINDQFLDNVLVFGERYSLFSEKNTDVIYGVKTDYNDNLLNYNVCLPGDPGYPRCDLYPSDPKPSDSDFDIGLFAKCLIRESFPAINLKDITRETFVAVGTSIYFRKNFQEAAKFIVKEVGEKVVGKVSIVAGILYTAYNSYICIKEQE